MTPSHYPDHEEEGNVTRLTAEEAARRFAATPEVDRAKRTDAQRHADEAFDIAQAELDTATEALGRSIRWAKTGLGIAIPREIADVRATLSEFRKLLADEREGRG